MSQRHTRIVATLEKRQPDLTVVMENVHKTRNFAAIARTCEAVGIGTVHAVSPEGSSVRLGHKTAGGTKKWITVDRHRTIDAAFNSLRIRGFQLVAADVGANAQDFRDMDYTRPTAIIVGSELDGLSALASNQADIRIKVPMMGMVESLNVSVATGVVLFEAARQREAAGMYAKRRTDDHEFERTRFEWLHPTVAQYCRERGLTYPRLDDNGDILSGVSGNERIGITALDDVRDVARANDEA